MKLLFPHALCASAPAGAPDPGPYPVGRVGLIVEAPFTSATEGTPITGVHGYPVCQVNTPFICQFPSTFSIAQFRCGVGSVHVPIAVNRWRTSKSDGPHSDRGFTGSVWLLANPGPSSDALSMLFEYVYAALKLNPCCSRFSKCRFSAL